MAIKYIPYYPETIEGQAILNNFTRTQRYLKYKDNNGLETSIAKGMPLYEMESLEKVGKNKNNNLVIRGECLSACAYLKENNIKVDLVYIDPPFASGADYAKKVYIRKNPKVVEAIKKAETELDNEDLKIFEETMYGDVWNKEAYLNWMYENLLAIKSVMSETASIYVHLDWHIGHYVKILMDEVFGEDNFKNEIVWGYRIQGVGKEFWARKHDNIYFYTKTPHYLFNAEKEDVIYEKPFIDTQCIEPDLSKLKERDINDIIDCLQSKKALKDKYKLILFNKYFSNVYVRDVWDCDTTKPIISGSSEYLDYKTQKPEGLLERIIKASSIEGMIVADFFAGSGVTCAVANKLGRKFITSDVGINSIQTTRDRLVSDMAEFEILEVKDGVSLYRNPQQTMNKLKTLIKGLKNEDGLDKFWEGAIQDSKLGLVPVYIPNLIEGKTRVLDTRLMNELIHIAMPDLSDKNIKKVIVYYIDIDNKQELEKFIQEQNDTMIDIELKDLKEILSEVVVDDEVVYSIKDNEIIIDKFVSDRVLQKIDEYNQKKQLNANKKGAEYAPLTISDDGLEMIEFVSIDCSNKSGTWQSDYEIKIEKDNYATINGVKTKEFWNGKIPFKNKPLRMKIRNICGDESIVELD